MDAGGHLGGNESAQVEEGDTDADGSGQRPAAHLVDTDDEVESLAEKSSFDAEVGQSTCSHQFPVTPAGVSGTSAKTSSGVETQLKCLNGQLMRNTVPTTSSSET